LSGGKYLGVGQVYAEEEEQCLAAAVASGDNTKPEVLFLIAEAALHNCGSQIADYASGRAEICILCIWLRPFPRTIVADRVGQC